MSTTIRTKLDPVTDRRPPAMPGMHRDQSLESEAALRQLLAEWNATEADYPKQACVHHLIEAQAGKTPEKIAVTFEDKKITYA
jgi:non-ribosomal peptide synthetase component F